jgi:hypothetical protein
MGRLPFKTQAGARNVTRSSNPDCREERRVSGSRLWALANNAIRADAILINSGALTMDAETQFDTCMRYRAVAGAGHLGGPVTN